MLDPQGFGSIPLAVGDLVLRVMRDHVLNLPRWNQPLFVSGCNLNLLMGTQVSFEKITFVFSST